MSVSSLTIPREKLQWWHQEGQTTMLSNQPIPVNRRRLHCPLGAGPNTRAIKEILSCQQMSHYELPRVYQPAKNSNLTSRSWWLFNTSLHQPSQAYYTGYFLATRTPTKMFPLHACRKEETLSFDLLGWCLLEDEECWTLYEVWLKSKRKKKNWLNNLKGRIGEGNIKTV